MVSVQFTDIPGAAGSDVGHLIGWQHIAETLLPVSTRPVAAAPCDVLTAW